jgi:8-oxo-dGTP pyrophosphatase MutT (NUDIX family)
MLTVEQIQTALQNPLPGVHAQRKMAPEPLPEQLNRWAQPSNYREAAVLLLLYPHARPESPLDWHIILTRRPEYDGVHSGQISFPGGRREGDESFLNTAMREAQEEIGLPPEAAKVVGQLSPLYIPPSNFYIYPYIAVSQYRPEFQPDPIEVAELIELPLSLLQDPTIFQTETWLFPNGIEREVPLFNIFGHKVWGATAMILNEFLTLILKGDIA